MSSIIEILGPYAMEGFSLTLTFLETQLCVSLFARNLRPRKFFFLRILFFEVLGITLFYGLAVYNTHAGTMTARVLCYLAITAYCLLYTGGIFAGKAEDFFIVFASGEAAHQFVGKLYPLLQNLRGINDKATISLLREDTALLQDWEWVVFFLFHVGMYLLLAQLLSPKRLLQKDKETSRSVGILSVIVIFMVNVLVCISRTYEGSDLMLSIIIKVFVMSISGVILALCAGIFSQNEKAHQLDVLQQLWKQDQAQFESVKAGMDMISMKCHDIKHILNRIEGKLNEEEIDQLRQAITFYDSAIKTGNEVLDVVLSEKGLVCQKQKIQFSCMVDGSVLSFLTPVQTYTIFGNIMDNAIEAVSKLPEDLRIVSLSCRKENGIIEIEESNYFDGHLLQSGITPDTTKPDQARHGFGIKSIQYVARQYGGEIETKAQEDMFFLRVVFPVQK